jgi:hypothetical protein
MRDSKIPKRYLGTPENIMSTSLTTSEPHMRSMILRRSWTRRSFIQTATTLSAATGIATMVPWSSAFAERSSALAQSSASLGFAFVASEFDTIQVFVREHPGGLEQQGVRDPTWTLIQTVACTAPASLTLSPDRRFLYAANAVSSFNHRPNGSVEAFGVDPLTGRIERLNRGPLAIHATLPEHLAVSPDARRLAVAIAGGAVYNLLELHPNGSIGPVTAVIRPLNLNPTGSQNAPPLPFPAPSPRPAVRFLDNATLLVTDNRGRGHRFLLSTDGAMSLDSHQAGATLADLTGADTETGTDSNSNSEALSLTSLLRRSGIKPLSIALFTA